MSAKKYNNNRQGAALLVVLFIVMVITIVSLGFLSRSDMEFACGQNMLLRTQMDYLAESGLEHARGLILNPQDISSENWTADAQQLVAGSDDYYNIEVIRDSNDPNDHCNYIIDCNSYRLNGVEQIGRSTLTAKLRLDPCIAYWVGSSTTVSPQITINGDVYCSGDLTNNGNINGDVFAIGLSGSIAGQHKSVGDLSLAWPRVTVQDFTSNYPVQIIDVSSLYSGTFGPYDPVQVCHRIGDLELAGDVQIEGMLIVDANLTISGNGNVITAGKNLPALLVSGNLIIEDGCGLDVYGLAIVEGQMQISAGAAGVNILGGLFVENGIVGGGNITITAAPAKTAIVVWSEVGVAEKWGQAAGAFFRNIER